MKNGSTTVPPCAFRLLDLGRFFRLTVGSAGWAEVAAIHADLTAGEGVDLTQAKPLPEKPGRMFRRLVKKLALLTLREIARSWFPLPNPNGKPNHLVVKPWINGLDLVRRPSDTWIIDFGTKNERSQMHLFLKQPFGTCCHT
jgi:hypothetical protein